MINILFATALTTAFALPIYGGEILALPVASVGAGEVTQQDISDWQALQSCYGPESLTSRNAGFMRMYEAAILEEVFRNQGKKTLKKEDYDAEAARIDRETRAPVILACIKKHFGGDGQRYRRVYIRPILLQRGVRGFVKDSPKIQAAAYTLRDKISKDIAKNKSFEAIAVERGVTYSTRTYSVQDDTAAPAGLEAWGRWSPFEANFINEHLKALKPGEVKAVPIEDEDGITFVRLISVTGVKYYFEALWLPKLTTEEYLKTIPKLSVRINDNELHNWVAPIKGNPLLSPADLEPQPGSAGAEPPKVIKKP